MSGEADGTPMAARGRGLKERTRRGHDEMWNPGDWGRMRDFFAGDIVVHTPTDRVPLRGHGQVTELFTMLQTAFPDRYIVIEDMIEEGDKVAVRWVLRGTHTGSYFGFPPTGRRVEVEELAVYRYADGLVAELWLMPNVMGSMQQLGLLPEGPPPRALLAVMGAVRRLRALLPGS